MGVDAMGGGGGGAAGLGGGGGEGAQPMIPVEHLRQTKQYLDHERDRAMMFHDVAISSGEFRSVEEMARQMPAEFFEQQGVEVLPRPISCDSPTRKDAAGGVGAGHGADGLDGVGGGMGRIADGGMGASDDGMLMGMGLPRPVEEAMAGGGQGGRIIGGGMGAFNDGMGGGMMPAPSALAPGGLSPNTRRGGSFGRRGGGGGGYRGGQRAGGSSGGSLGVLREGGGLDGGVDHDEALPDFLWWGSQTAASTASTPQEPY